MIERQNQSRDSQQAKLGGHGPFDGFAAATALGFAMTAQALDMWFGVVSGVAKASQDIFEAKDKAGETAAYSAAGKSATAKAKSATRTVVADIERTVQDVAEVAVDMLGGKTKEPVEDKPAVTPPANVGEVVAFEAETVAPRRAKVAKPTPKKATAPRAAEIPVKAEIKLAESVTAVSSPVDLGGSEAKEKAPAQQVSGESAAPTSVETASAPSQPTNSEPVVPVSAIMPEDFRQPRAIDKPEQPDDLKLIIGVGPKLEKVLNGLGVWSFAQVAAWTPEETAWVDDYLSLSGRIARDGWAGQADGLAKGLKAAS